MPRVMSSILIQEICTLTAIIVGAFWCRGYGEGKVKKAGFEDPLGSEQGNAVTLEVEPLLEERSGQHVPVDGLLLPEPLKGSESNRPSVVPIMTLPIAPTT